MNHFNQSPSPSENSVNKNTSCSKHGVGMEIHRWKNEGLFVSITNITIKRGELCTHEFHICEMGSVKFPHCWIMNSVKTKILYFEADLQLVCLDDWPKVILLLPLSGVTVQFNRKIWCRRKFLWPPLLPRCDSPSWYLDPQQTWCSTGKSAWERRSRGKNSLGGSVPSYWSLLNGNNSHQLVADRWKEGILVLFNPVFHMDGNVAHICVGCLLQDLPKVWEVQRGHKTKSKSGGGI